MSNQHKSAHYRTFLLTLCEERRNSNRPVVWRFRLADPRSGQRHSFATLDALMMALAQEIVNEDDNMLEERRSQ